MIKQFLSSNPQLKWLWVSITVIGLDQLTKMIAESQLIFKVPVQVFPHFEWYLTYNTGAAFSFLADAGGWQRWFFTITTICISLYILNWIRTLPKSESHTAISLSMILGGAIGNLIDRIAYGHVIDFIQVWLGSYPFPAFNIADSAICVGAATLIITSFTHPSADTEASSTDTPHGTDNNDRA